MSGLGAQMGCTGNDFCASRDGPREFAAKRLHNVVMWIEDLSGLGAQMGCTSNEVCASRDGSRGFAAKRLHSVVMWIQGLSGLVCQNGPGAAFRRPSRRVGQRFPIIFYLSKKKKIVKIFI